MKITPHFDSIEFKCKDGTLYPTAWYPRLHRLCDALEVIRETVGKPIRIISGFRTRRYNATIKGAAKDSRHIQGDGADFSVEGFTSRQLAEVIEGLIREKKIPEGGLGIYGDSHVHYDQRPYKARWGK